MLLLRRRRHRGSMQNMQNMRGAQSRAIVPHAREEWEEEGGWGVVVVEQKEV